LLLDECVNTNVADQHCRLDSLHEEVLVCNALRHSLEGHVTVFDLVKTLNRTNGLVDFFVQVGMSKFVVNH
jgi:hypothetical protein